MFIQRCFVQKEAKLSSKVQHEQVSVGGVMDGGAMLYDVIHVTYRSLYSAYTYSITRTASHHLSLTHLIWGQ